MATIAGRPENLSYLSPVGFKFLLNKLPNVEYFCQGITLPGISLMSVPLETPFTRIPYPGDRVEFQDFIVRFIIITKKIYVKIFIIKILNIFRRNFIIRYSCKSSKF